MFAKLSNKRFREVKIKIYKNSTFVGQCHYTEIVRDFVFDTHFQATAAAEVVTRVTSFNLVLKKYIFLVSNAYESIFMFLAIKKFKK